MFLKTDNPRTVYLSKVNDYLISWLEAFLIDRKSAGLADGSLRFYRQKLKLLADFCDAQSVQMINQITTSFLRQYLLVLEETGHNAGGRHGAFRAMRAFFLWYEDEVEPKGWSNPIRKVKAPKVPVEPLEPVSFETVAQLVKSCPRGSFT
jgi:site-specific recombinase XerD